MEAFEIIYRPKVIRDDIPKLSKVDALRVRQTVDNKLTTYPYMYGKPLRYPLSGYFKLRVGDYRILFRIKGTKVLVEKIAHRSMVYKNLKRVRN